MHGGEKLARIESAKDTAERVMAGHSELQSDIPLEPVELAPREAFYIRPTLGSTDHRGQRQKDHFD
jgi:hypothetical protein